MNPFTSVTKSKNDLKLNVWDWSHDFHFSTEMGRILPCFCARLGAKQSLSINCKHAEQLMPLMFPIQNKLRARVSFFKISIRALWKHYQDYISNVNQVDAQGKPINSRYEEPYISIRTNKTQSPSFYSLFERFFGTGSNLDYLGLPTTYDSNVLSPAQNLLLQDFAASEPILIPGSTVTNITSTTSNTVIGYRDGEDYCCHIIPVPGSKFTIEGNTLLSGSVIMGSTSLDIFGSSTTEIPANLGVVFFVTDNFLTVTNIIPGVIDSTISMNNSSFSCTLSEDIPLSSNGWSIGYYFTWRKIATNDPAYKILVVDNTGVAANTTIALAQNLPVVYSPEYCPWFAPDRTDTNKGLKLSSYPLRAYEAVYNAFFRNNRNNPLSVGGIKKYNDWVLARDMDGDDTENYRSFSIDGELSGEHYFYDRKYCNWEPDQFTTAVQSPQEGVAPLVGLTTYATTYEENGQEVTRLNSVLTDEDGQSYSVRYQSDEEGLKGVEYEATTLDASTGRPITSRYQAVSEGISIEDFRQVNAYQRYLELNMRRGYSYKDIIEGRFDVNVRYDELLMPEFCGGFTRNIDVVPVTQTTPTNESGTYQGALGSQAGQAFGRGENEGNINIFCDEDSIVLGVMVCYPDAVYTQNLPKHFLYRDPLDIFNPEFAQIGFQPITLSEVAPIQTWNNDKTKMNSVFGYQRPWYEMLSRVNEAHGLFRTQLRNFLMNRRFSGVPELSKEFLLIHPDQVNDVFSVTETTDKIFGMLRFDIRHKNAVPRNNVPRIE